MSYQLSITQSQVLTALRSVLLTALPTGTEVIQGQDNQVAEPIGQDFVVMTPILRTRLETNTETYADVAFTGSISGGVLTVTAVRLGVIQPGATLFGPSVTAGTIIGAQITGTTGGVGAYSVSPAQGVTSGTLSAGGVAITQPTQLTAQIDVHGPASGDNVQIISTLMRSAIAVDLFRAQGVDVTPLYESGPRQTPFLNEAQQIERTWSCDVELQINPTVTGISQQFTDSADVNIHEPIDVVVI